MRPSRVVLPPMLTEAEAETAVAQEAVQATACPRHLVVPGEPCPGVTLGACAERRRFWDAL